MVARHALPGKSVHTDTDDDQFSFHPNGHARKAEKLVYLLDRRVAFGTLTVVEGRKGAGKSTFLAALAADVTGGTRLPGGRKKRTLGPVLWLTQEESYFTAVLPRIQAAGGDAKLILWPQGKAGEGPARMVFPGHFKELERVIVDEGIKLVVMDPWASFLDSRCNQNDEQQGRAVTERLIDIGHRTAAAFVLARHLRKNTQGHALDHGSGSVAIGAAARSVLRIEAFPGRPGWTVIVRVGGNLGPPPPALAWELVDAGNVASIAWRGEHAIDAEELAAGQADAGERDESDNATDLLRTKLKDGWCAWKDLHFIALNNGISDRTLRRRKAELGILSRRRQKDGQPFYEWGPPPGGWPK